MLSRPIDLGQWEPPIWHQGNTNSCVGQGDKAMITIVENQAFGESIDYSALGIYTNSRLEHLPFKWAPLFDTGTYPRLAVKALSKNGVPTEKAWPFSLSRKNKRLPFHVRAEAEGAKGAKYAFLFGVGDRLIDEIIQALRSGYPVGFGTRVSVRYSEQANPVETRPTSDDKIAGNHWQVIVGARLGSDGQVQFKVRNSWGRFWGQGGYVWLTANYITWPFSRDFLVIYGWDRIRDARPNITL